LRETEIFAPLTFETPWGPMAYLGRREVVERS